jgi:hypothetical protein
MDNKIYCINCEYYDHYIHTPFLGDAYNKCLRMPKIIDSITIPGCAISPGRTEYIYEDCLMKCQIENKYNNCEYFKEES